MRFLRTWLVLVLAISWAPLHSHCSLEALPGFEFLRCEPNRTATHSCANEKDPAHPAHPADPCSDAGCCAVESAKYRSTRPQDAVPVPITITSPATLLNTELTPAPPSPNSLIALLRPPDLPAPWQVLLRAAPQPRAPSLDI